MLEIIPCYQPDSFSLSANDQQVPWPTLKEAADCFSQVCRGRALVQGGTLTGFSVCKQTCYTVMWGMGTLWGEKVKCIGKQIGGSVTVYVSVYCACRGHHSRLCEENSETCSSVWVLWPSFYTQYIDAPAHHHGNSLERTACVWAVWEEIFEVSLGCGKFGQDADWFWKAGFTYTERTVRITKKINKLSDI